MSRVLSDDDIEAIAERLSSWSGLSTEEHRKHHEALELFIENQKDKKQHWDKIKEQVSGWGVVAILGGIGSLIYHGAVWFIDNIKH